jgi:hypothetical protein
MSSRFEDESHDKTEYDQQQEKDAFPSSRVLLVPINTETSEIFNT